MLILLKDILQSDQKKAVEVASGLFKDRRSAGAKANTEFFSGNHWQDGKGWIGAKPLAIHGRSQIMAQIQEGFVSENVVKEVIDRHVGGILGREPLWGFVPQQTVSQTTLKRRRRFAKLFSLIFQDQSQTQLDKFAQEADEALTVWWDHMKPRKRLKEALATCLNEEKVLLRFFVPRGLRDANGNIAPQPSLTDALNFVHIDLVTSDKGGVFTDSETQKPFAVYVYQDGDNKLVELSYVDALGRTILEVLSEKPELRVKPTAYELQGRLWMYEFSREPLITEQIRGEQKSLNLAKTMMMRNVNLAGNLERAIMNAERPRQSVRIPDPNSGLGFREETVNTDFLVGPGVTNFLTGLLIRDDEGKVIGRADPNISYRDPAPIDTFVGTRRECRESILGQAQQLHILISGDSTVSGRSRQQARAEYRGSLLTSKESLDDAGRAIVETPLRIAAQFCNRVNDFAGLRCDFDSRVEDGPVSSEERTANREDVSAGLMSKETAMSRNGADDTDAELARIAQEKAGEPEPPIPAIT